MTPEQRTTTKAPDLSKLYRAMDLAFQERDTHPHGSGRWQFYDGKAVGLSHAITLLGGTL